MSSGGDLVIPTETVIRRRATVVQDAYQDPVLDWTAPSELEIRRCVVYPAGSSETVSVGREQLVEKLTVLPPASADIRPDDRLLIRGNEYEIDGAGFDYDRRDGAPLTAIRWQG